LGQSDEMWSYIKNSRQERNNMYKKRNDIIDKDGAGKVTDDDDKYFAVLAKNFLYLVDWNNNIEANAEKADIDFNCKEKNVVEKFVSFNNRVASSADKTLLALKKSCPSIATVKKVADDPDDFPPAAGPVDHESAATPVRPNADNGRIGELDRLYRENAAACFFLYGCDDAEKRKVANRIIANSSTSSSGRDQLLLLKSHQILLAGALTDANLGQILQDDDAKIHLDEMARLGMSRAVWEYIGNGKVKKYTGDRGDPRQLRKFLKDYLPESPGIIFYSITLAMERSLAIQYATTLKPIKAPASGWRCDPVPFEKLAVLHRRYLPDGDAFKYRFRDDIEIESFARDECAVVHGLTEYWRWR